MSSHTPSTQNRKGPKPSSKPRGGRAKKTADEDDEDTPADPKSRGPCVHWDSPRTDRLIEWLENNVEDRQWLFSDSAQDAKEEKRRRCVAKNVKTSFHVKMADYVFSADDDMNIRDDFRENGVKYAKAVKNHIAR